MKQLHFVLLFILCVFVVQAGSFDKEYKKLIEKYDVADSAK